MKEIISWLIFDKQTVAQSNFLGLSIQFKFITKMWLTIQIQFSKWIDNSIQIQSQSDSRPCLWQNQNHVIPVIPKRHPFINFQLWCQVNCLKILMKRILALILEHDALCQCFSTFWASSPGWRQIFYVIVLVTIFCPSNVLLIMFFSTTK